jgi:PAS domain S-box-containing protein
MLVIAPFLIWPTLATRAFDSSYLPHLYCYLAKPGLVWTHVVADSLIGLSYLAISATLAYLVYSGRRDIPFQWMFLAFGLFIVACGGTHFVEVLTIWIPVYVFSAAVKVLTAAVSVLTAVLLPFTVPRIRALVQGTRISAENTARLRVNEGRLRAITETATDGIISANSQGHILYLNQAAMRMFDYPVAEVVGQPLTVLMPERFHAAYEEGLKRFLTTREVHVIGKTVELVGKRKDGVEFPLDLSISAWEADGETFFTGILRDSTEHKKASERIRLQNALLEVANKELESFSYSVSHDLRSPLRAIHGFSGALLEDCGDSLDATGKNHLQRILAASQRMGQLIDGMLQLAHTARRTMLRETVSFSSLAEEIVSQLQKSEPDRHVWVEIAPNLTVEGDQALLHAMLQNLLGNAWKFTSKCVDARIEVGTQTQDGLPIYFVRDNGAGFDMQYAGKLFGAFQRLHDARDYPGTGIGLATVQKIIQRHGGRIWAESQVGRGSTFYFALDPPDSVTATLSVSAVTESVALY